MEREQAEKFYGKDAVEWLRRWDANEGVWSVEMGGIGPGYEQAIQVIMAEMLRIMIELKCDHTKWDDREEWKKQRDEIEKLAFKNKVIENIGPSGAQWGAAMGLACHFYRRGPAICLEDEEIKERKIQIRKQFP